MLGELASGRDPLSTILVGVPLVMGLAIRGLLLVGALADKTRRV